VSNQAKAVVGVVVVALLGLTFAFTVDFDDFTVTFGRFVAAWLTIVILSFLYQDNPFYKAAEHVMVGLAMGYFTVYYVDQVLRPRFWDKLVGGKLRLDEELFGSQDVFRYALIIPAVLGFLMLFRLFPKLSWLSRWPMALMIGISSGLAIPVSIEANITEQVLEGVRTPIEYMTALRGGADRPWWSDVTLWQVGVPVLIVGTICALMYFFFSVPHKGVVGRAARVGVWVLMLGFGASFGYTVMARLSLFIGRVLFLLRDWLDVLQT